MDEARRVIERLDRIEALKREGSPARTLLGEVRQLLLEGEEWLAAERVRGEGERAADGELQRAGQALGMCRAQIKAGTVGAGGGFGPREGVVPGTA